ncbi:nuclear transport factor 2 family protein [Promicromonospora sp. MS192]|uniref:nuclear transport factor 2 family protein n=1 Tax=Promicromonospora sp. MS192 TaxID=3412684 RepID=UPI003C2F20F5
MARTLDDTFAAIDALDADGFVAGLSTDVVLTFGNAPAATGHEEVRAACAQLWQTIGGVRHRVQDLWHPEPDVTVAYIQVDYTRLDGTVVTVPCVDILRWKGDVVADWRIVIDVAPVFAPAEETAEV